MGKSSSAIWKLPLFIGFALTLAAASPPRVININSGSQVGWIPSEELDAEMVAAAMTYWQYEAEGEYKKAYAMHGAGLAELMTFTEYESQKKTTASEMGPIVSRNVYKQTWTHGASYTPTRGTYLAIDFSAKYQKAQRVCGYIIVHKEKSDSAAVILRTETVQMLDASFNDQKEAAAAWRKASAYCPNYVAE